MTSHIYDPTTPVRSGISAPGTKTMFKHLTLRRSLIMALVILLLIGFVILTLAAWESGCSNAFGPAVCGL